MLRALESGDPPGIFMQALRREEPAMYGQVLVTSGLDKASAFEAFSQHFITAPFLPIYTRARVSITCQHQRYDGILQMSPFLGPSMGRQTSPRRMGP